MAWVDLRWRRGRKIPAGGGMSTLNEPAAKRIGKLVRMFGATEEEAQVAVLKLRILLSEAKLSFNDIATVIENGNGEIEQLKYSDQDAELIFARGIEEGRKQAEYRTRTLGAIFRRRQR